MVEEDEESSLTALDESDEVQELEGVEGSFLLFYNLFIILYICALIFFFRKIFFCQVVLEMGKLLVLFSLD